MKNLFCLYSVDPDEMQHNAAFHLANIRCLHKYSFRDLLDKRIKPKLLFSICPEDLVLKYAFFIILFQSTAAMEQQYPFQSSHVQILYSFPLEAKTF